MRFDPKVAIIVGLACAALAQFLALFLAGAGHGWIAPFFASAALWLLLPISFVFATGEYRRRRWALVALLVAAAGANSALLLATRDEGIEYFERTLEASIFPFTITWLALWFSWQIVVLIALVRRHPIGSAQ